MYEHNALGNWSGLTLCLTKVRSSRARCPATALIYKSTSGLLQCVLKCLPIKALCTARILIFKFKNLLIIRKY